MCQYAAYGKAGGGQAAGQQPGELRHTVRMADHAASLGGPGRRGRPGLTAEAWAEAALTAITEAGARASTTRRTGWSARSTRPTGSNARCPPRGPGHQPRHRAAGRQVNRIGDVLRRHRHRVVFAARASWALARLSRCQRRAGQKSGSQMSSSSITRAAAASATGLAKLGGASSAASSVTSHTRRAIRRYCRGGVLYVNCGAKETEPRGLLNAISRAWHPPACIGAGHRPRASPCPDRFVPFAVLSRSGNQDR